MLKLRIRALVGIMIFLGYFLIYIVRYNLSVHIVDMIQISRKKIINETNIRIALYLQGSAFDIINWDDRKVAKLFAAYHIGYCICFPIFHNLGDRLGPTWVVGIAGMTSGILSCLTPASVYCHFWAVFVVRIIKGFCAGAMQPSMLQVLRHWVPPMERNHFMWAYCGNTLGTCCTFLLCAAVQFYSKWPVGFFVAGGVQILWAMVWVLFVTDYPRRHPCISDDELKYLLSAIGNIFTIKLTNLHTPWLSIIKSIPFWALCTLNFGYAWMIISICMYGPFFYCKVVKYSIYTASALTALPFFLRLIIGTIVIQTFHWYRHNTNLRRIKHIRKYFIVVSHVIPGLLVMMCWLLPMLPGPLVLTIAVAFTAAGMDLTLDLCYELTPTFVNSVNTIIKIVGNTSGIILCFCVGEVTFKYKNTPEVWKDIWCFHASVLFLSGMVFLLWGDTHVQPWNAFTKQPKRKKYHVRPKHSVMSNILEVDEESIAAKSSQSKKKLSIGLFKSSATKLGK